MIPILKAFQVGNEHGKQLTGTTMGTPMTLNYANVFMTHLKQKYCLFVFWQLGYHFWYSFMLLIIFSSWRRVIKKIIESCHYFHTKLQQIPEHQI